MGIHLLTIPALARWPITVVVIDHRALEDRIITGAQQPAH